MRFDLFKIIFPEGDEQEIEHRLRINQIVDLNGFPMPLPIPSMKTLAYRVVKISTENTRNEIITNYHLEQLLGSELEELL